MPITESSSSASNPLISIIVPTYNVENYILDTLNSALSQSYSEIEVLVVDDCSLDATPELLREIADKDPRLKYYSLNSNSGNPSAPRNLGISKSRGEYIAFLDADDIWYEKKLERQLAAMLSTQLDFSCTYVAKFVSSIKLDKELDFSSGCEQINHHKLLRKNIIATSSVMLKSTLMDGHSFSTQSEDIGVEDYLLWLQLHQIADINSGLIQTVSAGYRVREKSLSRSKIRMASRVFRLLSRYESNGRKLGLKKYYYFATYFFGAIQSKMYKSLNL